MQVGEVARAVFPMALVGLVVLSRQKTRSYDFRQDDSNQTICKSRTNPSWAICLFLFRQQQFELVIKVLKFHAFYLRTYERLARASARYYPEKMYPFTGS